MSGNLYNAYRKAINFRDLNEDTAEAVFDFVKHLQSDDDRRIESAKKAADKKDIDEVIGYLGRALSD